MTETSRQLGTPVSRRSDSDLIAKEEAPAPDLKTPIRCCFDIYDIERLEQDFGVRIGDSALKVR
jgi:hypothetical protein